MRGELAGAEQRAWPRGGERAGDCFDASLLDTALAKQRGEPRREIDHGGFEAD
jgi:hypothetical protein